MKGGLYIEPEAEGALRIDDDAFGVKDRIGPRGNKGASIVVDSGVRIAKGPIRSEKARQRRLRMSFRRICGDIGLLDVYEERRSYAVISHAPVERSEHLLGMRKTVAAKDHVIVRALKELPQDDRRVSGGRSVPFGASPGELGRWAIVLGTLGECDVEDGKAREPRVAGQGCRERVELVPDAEADEARSGEGRF